MSTGLESPILYCNHFRAFKDLPLESKLLNVLLTGATAKIPFNTSKINTRDVRVVEHEEEGAKVGKSRTKYINVWRNIEIRIWFLGEQNANGMHKIRFHQCAISWPDWNAPNRGWEPGNGRSVGNETERNRWNVYEKKGRSFNFLLLRQHGEWLRWKTRMKIKIKLINIHWMGEEKVPVE